MPFACTVQPGLVHKNKPRNYPCTHTVRAVVQESRAAPTNSSQQSQSFRTDPALLAILRQLAPPAADVQRANVPRLRFTDGVALDLAPLLVVSRSTSDSLLPVAAYNAANLAPRLGRFARATTVHISSIVVTSSAPALPSGCDYSLVLGFATDEATATAADRRNLGTQVAFFGGVADSHTIEFGGPRRRGLKGWSNIGRDLECNVSSAGVLNVTGTATGTTLLASIRIRLILRVGE